MSEGAHERVAAERERGREGAQCDSNHKCQKYWVNELQQFIPKQHKSCSFCSDERWGFRLGRKTTIEQTQLEDKDAMPTTLIICYSCSLSSLCKETRADVAVSQGRLIVWATVRTANACVSLRGDCCVQKNKNKTHRAARATFSATVALWHVALWPLQ